MRRTTDLQSKTIKDIAWCPSGVVRKRSNRKSDLKELTGPPLVAQWLRLCDSIAWGMGSSLTGKLRFHVAYGIVNPVYEIAKETLMYRTVLWTLWERERVGRFGRMALKHVKYHV